MSYRPISDGWGIAIVKLPLTKLPPTKLPRTKLPPTKLPPKNCHLAGNLFDGNLTMAIFVGGSLDILLFKWQFGHFLLGSNSLLADFLKEIFKDFPYNM